MSDDKFQISEPVENLNVVLKFNDTIIIKQATTSEGTYSFKIKRVKSPVRLFVEGSKLGKSKSGRHKCGFLAFNDVRAIDSISQKTVIIENFKVNPVLDCVPQPPAFYFNTNSIEFASDYSSRSYYDMPADSALMYFKSMLVEYPQMVIEISGHADLKENNGQKISADRAQIVKEKLVSMGIDRDRLQTKSYSSTQMIFSKDQILAAKTTGEREAMRQANRRVTIKVIRFDFQK
jgi:outer membrane protein OmpA-like peptidoglycan-associated protein